MLDIRIPIGLLFVILGVVVTIFGFITLSDIEMYKRALGVNINLWTGISMLVFGGFMLLLVKFKKRSNGSEK